ncbi:MAG: hypothetical protein AAB886_00040 [Patescibacteria group bacterium]
MINIFSNFFGGREQGPEGREKKPELKVGDLVKHPFREGNTPILFLGDDIYVFVPHAYKKEFDRGRRIGTYEAIDGSKQFQELSEDSRFEKVSARIQPSVEIDFSDEDEPERTLVVPIDQLFPAR